MSELDRQAIGARLGALYENLAEFPAGVYCPWPLSRVFNELLQQTKREIGDDPIVASVASLKKAESQDGHEVSGTSVGSVRALAAQARVALDSAPETTDASSKGSGSDSAEQKASGGSPTEADER